MKKNPLIRTEPKPQCACCGSNGDLLYPKLKDRLFGVAGEWNIKRCSSQGCGLMWLDPKPINEDIHLAYQSYYTHTIAYKEERSLFSSITLSYQALRFRYQPVKTSPFLGWIGIFLSMLPFFKESMDYPFIYLKNVGQGKLLELGVGSGEMLKKFMAWGWDAEGLDFDPKAVQACAAIGLKVKEGDLDAQHFAEESFDAIFSSHVLEHVSEPLALMEESLRVLKEGGMFVAVTPNSKSVLHSLFKSNWRGLEPPRHLNIFTANALLDSAKKAGFSRVEVSTSNFSAAGVFYYSAHLVGMRKTFVLRVLSNVARLILTVFHLIVKQSGEELILIAYK